MPVAEVLQRVSPAEFFLWRRHFLKHPPEAVEVLMAKFVASQYTTQGGKPVQDHQVRPWAYSRKQIDAEKERATSAVNAAFNKTFEVGKCPVG